MASEIEVEINGKKQKVNAAPDTPLLWVIRDELGMTGTKYGCGMSLCGACTVLVGGQAMRSCMMPISAAVGQSITTIEGLNGKVGEAVQKAWANLSVPQCGYCQSGQVLAATALLAKKRHPSDADIDDAMSGNICRCGTYNDIKRAIHAAAKTLA